MKCVALLSLLFSLSAFAQQEPLTSFYWNNYSYFNPAMIGVEYKHESNVTWRNQWDGVSGAPNTLFANYGTNLSEKHGIGANYVHEARGFSRMHRVKVNYNYQLKLKTGGKLVLGTALAYNNYRWPLVECLTGIDPSENNLPYSTSNSYNLDMGVAYYGKNLIVGVSSTQIPIYSESDVRLSSAHLFGNIRYNLPFMGSSSLIFETQLRTDFNEYSQDINLGYNWNNTLEARVGWRTSDAVILHLTGIIADNYQIGYSYDFTINQLSTISRGSHEITLGLKLRN